MNEPEATPKIQGRVAEILSAREVVINIGSQQGVRRGMKFAILAERPLDIVDPETDEILDVIDREKVRVEAAEVRDRVSICKTYKTRTIGAGSGFFATMLQAQQMQRMFEPPKVIVETLRVEDSQFPAPLDPEDSYVKINDRVVLIESVATIPQKD